MLTNLQTAAPAGLTSHWVLTPQGEGLHCPAAHPTRAPNHTNKISIEKYLDSLKQKQGLLVWGSKVVSRSWLWGRERYLMPLIYTTLSPPPPLPPEFTPGDEGRGVGRTLYCDKSERHAEIIHHCLHISIDKSLCI